jgi:hypothetical protein
MWGGSGSECCVCCAKVSVSDLWDVECLSPLVGVLPLAGRLGHIAHTPTQEEGRHLIGGVGEDGARARQQGTVRLHTSLTRGGGGLGGRGREVREEEGDLLTFTRC